MFERSLIAGLGDTEKVQSVGYNLRSTRFAASAVRERLSQEHWNVIVQAEEDLLARCTEATRSGDFSALEAMRLLETTSTATAAMTGAQTDRMTRDDGWRLLSIGRHVERLGFLSSALARALASGATATTGGFESVLSLFDSSITFHSQYQQGRELPALLDLLVLDRDNPRSLGWVAHTLAGRLAKLAGEAKVQDTPLAREVLQPARWSLEEICAVDGEGKHADLLKRLEGCVQSAYDISDAVGAIYFTHSRDAKTSVGA